jgi:hypothetical protein
MQAVGKKLEGRNHSLIKAQILDGPIKNSSKYILCPGWGM